MSFSKCFETETNFENQISKDDIIHLLIHFNFKPNMESLEEKSKSILREITGFNSINSLSLKDFIFSFMSNSNLLATSNNKSFYLNALQYFLTPREQIIDILIKAKSDLPQNTSTAKKIDWVIQTLKSKGMFDIDKFQTFIQGNTLYDQNINPYSYKKLKEEGFIQNALTDSKRNKKRNSTISLNLPVGTSLLGYYMQILSTIDNIDFNIFTFREEIGIKNTGNKVMYTISNYIFKSWNLFDTIVTKEKFKLFIKEISRKYSNNPYHNSMHASDVLQTINIILKNGNFKEKMVFDDLDFTAIFIATLIHDIGHPGLSNAYQINAKTKIALRYNDISPLENMHCYKGLKLLSSKEIDILENLSNEEKYFVRKRIISAILATDGALHGKIFTPVNSKVKEIEDLNGNIIEDLIPQDMNKKFNAQQDLINLIIHAADVSNPAKKFEIYSQWTDFIMNEFFAEGDLEKRENLPINVLCDRETTSIPKAQIGFINFVVLPTFILVSKIANGTEYYVDNCKNNIDIWRNKLSEEEEEKKGN